LTLSVCMYLGNAALFIPTDAVFSKLTRRWEGWIGEDEIERGRLWRAYFVLAYPKKHLDSLCHLELHCWSIEEVLTVNFVNKYSWTAQSSPFSVFICSLSSRNINTCFYSGVKISCYAFSNSHGFTNFLPGFFPCLHEFLVLIFCNHA
jgi:hypothetical protein